MNSCIIIIIVNKQIAIIIIIYFLTRIVKWCPHDLKFRPIYMFKDIILRYEFMHLKVSNGIILRIFFSKLFFFCENKSFYVGKKFKIQNYKT